MEEIQVDVVGPQPLEARVDRLRDTGGVTRCDLGGEHHLIAPVAEGLADELLRLPAAVALRGVEVGDAGIDGRVDDGPGALGVDPHAEVVAAEPRERHLE